MKVDIPHTSLQRDIQSKAILETDLRKVDEYQVKRKILDTNKAKAAQAERDINTLKDDVSGLKNDMDELKALIKGLYK